MSLDRFTLAGKQGRNFGLNVFKPCLAFLIFLFFEKMLQGFAGPKDSALIIERFAALPLLQPDRDDHIAAAEIRNTCRRAGVQIGTIDALLVQLCLCHDLTLLSTDNDFALAARHFPTLRIWSHKVKSRRK